MVFVRPQPVLSWENDYSEQWPVDSVLHPDFQGGEIFKKDCGSYSINISAAVTVTSNSILVGMFVDLQGEVDKVVNPHLPITDENAFKCGEGQKCCPILNVSNDLSFNIKLALKYDTKKIVVGVVTFTVGIKSDVSIHSQIAVCILKTCPCPTELPPVVQKSEINLDLTDDPVYVNKLEEEFKKSKNNSQ